MKYMMKNSKYLKVKPLLLFSWLRFALWAHLLLEVSLYYSIKKKDPRMPNVIIFHQNSICILVAENNLEILKISQIYLQILLFYNYRNSNNNLKKIVLYVNFIRRFAFIRVKPINKIFVLNA